MVGRENFHWLIAVCSYGSRLNDSLIMEEGKLRIASELPEDFDVSSEFVDFVFEVCKYVRGIVSFDEIDDIRYYVFPPLRSHENQGSIEVFELLLHQTECLYNEVTPCRACSVPFELCRAVDINADQRFGLLLRKRGSIVQSFVILDPQVFASEPVNDIVHYVDRVLGVQGFDERVKWCFRVDLLGAFS